MGKKSRKSTTTTTTTNTDISKNIEDNRVKRQKATELLDEALALMLEVNDELSDSEEVFKDIDNAISTLRSKEDPCDIAEVSEDNIELFADEDLLRTDLLTISSDVSERSGQKRIKLHSSLVTSDAIQSSSTSGLKYAPKMPTKAGTYDLYPISLEWTDDDGVSISQLNNMAREVASIVHTLSNGTVILNVKKANIHRTNLQKGAEHVKSESDEAKIKFTDKNSKNRAFYAIVNNGAKNRSHAGNNVASLLSALIVTAGHEVLHLLGLKHANRYGISTEGKNKGEIEFQSSRDGSSIMSIYSSKNLTAPQKWAMGWYAKEQVAMYEIGDPSVTYSLQPVCEKQSSNYVNAVYIERDKQTPLFLSMFEMNKKNKNRTVIERALALHVGEKGGSTRLQVFGKNTEIDNLSFEVVEQNKDCWKVKVAPKF